MHIEKILRLVMVYWWMCPKLIAEKNVQLIKVNKKKNFFNTQAWDGSSNKCHTKDVYYKKTVTVHVKLQLKSRNLSSLYFMILFYYYL